MTNTDDHVNSHRDTEILIVGAGMAGLIAAAALKQRGHTVVVVDKGRGVGGRLASRRVDTASFDHGAQFVTARDPRFCGFTEHLAEAGVAEEWFRSTDAGPPPHTRWRGRPAMTAIAKHLARNTNLLLGNRVNLIRRNTAGWIADLDSGESISARSALLTAPVPQALALLETGGAEPPDEVRTRLKRVTYERCLAVMAVLEAPSRIPRPGFLRPPSGPVAWLADNQVKGVSATPAVTIHGTATFSMKHWDHDRIESGRVLLRAAQSWLGAKAVVFQVHGWRYSRPVSTEESQFAVLNQLPPLLLAGDAFGGPRVEGAALSGWAAADALEALGLHGSRVL